MPPVTSLAEVRKLLVALPGPDEEAAAAAARREPQLTKPAGSLGRLEELAAWMAAWQGRHPPTVDRPMAVVFAGNHGVAAQGVSAFPAEVTHQMVANFKAGGAAINQLCASIGIELRVGALALDRPVRDFTQAPAMDEADCVEAIAYGMAAVEDGIDLLVLGEMGIANTTPSAAICHALFGADGAFWTGPGTGVAGSQLANKARVVGEGVARHRAAMTDGLEVLRHVGGRELAAIAGAVLAARLKRVPVMLDGYVCTSAAAVLEACRPGALDHCQVGHASSEPGHVRLLERLDKRPLLDLGMRLGEASGAALAVALVKAAVACHAGMATFAEAVVSRREG
ncbi:MAG: nicotinate-nucleotide--dimethylbenzimidazole phosphoribosyltransferase [Magnetospirillum sp. WYHS-4]